MLEKWTRQKLSRMLYHSFIGTIADNVIEIGWILCFSLIADKFFVERVTTMFGLNDAFWVILSSTYYTTRTALVSRMPKLIVQNGEEVESQQLKTAIYLFYILLAPLAVASYFHMPRLLTLLGVSASDFALYLPYFRLSVVSILLSAPWSVMVPAYYRAKGNSRDAMFLDHAVAWSMLIGIFITTHLLHLGVLWALIVNMASNAIPLFWFLLKRPIPRFFAKGFEFSFGEIKQYWKIVKWELVRRLAPRISALVGAGMMLSYNPVVLGVKYWVSNLAMFLEGWVDASAGLLNSHVSRNVGLGEEVPYKDNSFVFWRSFAGVLLSTVIIYIAVILFLSFLPAAIYNGLINPWIWLFLFVEMTTKDRYYMWLSISRSYRQDLNGIAQLIYAIPTIVLTPTFLYLGLNVFHLGLIGVFATGSVVGCVQWILAEVWFRWQLKLDEKNKKCG